MQERLHTPFVLGTVEVPGRMFLAPMAGITDDVMRLICKRMGLSLIHIFL